MERQAAKHMPQTRYRVLYTDIGGVLGTNGWDTGLRADIAGHFGVDLAEIEPRHHLMFDSYERGYLSFEEYLARVFFASPRDFTIEDLREYTYNASVPWPDNIDFFRRVKMRNGLKVGLISNEGRGIAEHRCVKFGLRELADFLVISHFVHMRKPDHEIWKLALNLAQVQPEESIYVDDRALFVAVAADLGFTAFQHVSLADTMEQLRSLELQVD